MSRMRRVVRMRRITATAAAGLSLSLVAYAGTSSTGERGTAPPLTARSPSVTTSPAAETEQAKVARLNAALGALTMQAMPGARFVADLPQDRVGPFEFYVFRPHGVPTTSPYNYLQASADVHDRAGVGTVSVIIGRTLSAPGAEWWCDTAGTPHQMAASAGGPLGGEGDIPPGCTGQVAWAGIRLGVFGSCTEATDRTSCAQSTGPHGETVVTTTRHKGTSVEYQVDITRPDGTTMILMSQKRSAPPTRCPQLPGRRHR
jgi:hypothetical protein